MNRIIHGSYIKSDLELIDNSIDMFFCDPPYFISNNQWDKQWKNLDEYLEWTNHWLELAYKKLKQSGSIYVCISWEYSGYIQKIMEDVGFHIKNRITWKRDKGRGSKTNWKNMHEDIWFAVKDKNNYTFNIDDVKIKKKVIAPYKDKNGDPKDWWETDTGERIRLTHPGNLWDEFCVPYWSMHEVRSYAKSKREPQNKFQKHPTQKPKDLVKRCILASSNENELIVDFFGGSGTTAVASKELNRNYILFEIDDEYVKIIYERLNNE
tara:strand:+ start:594 stop:1391 length:798 start_codon:yes stop_codon:yes gene_type:complete